MDTDKLNLVLYRASTLLYRA